MQLQEEGGVLEDGLVDAGEVVSSFRFHFFRPYVYHGVIDLDVTAWWEDVARGADLEVRVVAIAPASHERP